MKFISSLMHNSIVITEVKKMLVNFFGVGIVLFFVKEGKYYFFKIDKVTKSALILMPQIKIFFKKCSLFL